MSRVRSAFGALAVLLLAASGLALSIAPAAEASAARWTGSHYDDPLANNYKHPNPELSISGSFSYNSSPITGQDPAPSTRIDSIYFTIRASDDYKLPSGCSVPSIDPMTGLSSEPSESQDPAVHKVSFFRSATFGCNGRYVITTTACTLPGCSNASPPEEPQDWHKLTVTVTIAAAPGPVQNLTVARGEGRSIKLSWEPVAVKEPDFAGYLVERAVGSERYGIVKRVGGLSYTDQAPDEGGTIRYRVRALRSAPGGYVPTDPGAAKVVTISVPAAPTTTSGGSGGGGTSGTLPPRSYVPPSSSGSVSFDTPDTADTGYDDFLPYGDLEPGNEDAVLPDDEGFAAVNYDDEESAGLLVPVASALVLVMWAVHIRYINRLARR